MRASVCICTVGTGSTNGTGKPESGLPPSLRKPAFNLSRFQINAGAEQSNLKYNAPGGPLNVAARHACNAWGTCPVVINGVVTRRMSGLTCDLTVTSRRHACVRQLRHTRDSEIMLACEHRCRNSGVLIAHWAGSCDRPIKLQTESQ